MMRIMSKLLCVAALAASVAFPADASAGDVFDGLSVWLDFRGDGPSAGGGAVGNLLDATAGSPLGGSHETNRAALVSVEVVPPALPWETNVVKALRLPQCFDAETGKIMPVALDLPQAAVDAAVQTAYVRFRWDGAPNPSKAYSEWLILNGYSWGAESGWGLGVSNVANADPARGNLCCMVPQKTMVFSWNDGFSLSPGVWYDLFVQLSPSEDEKKTVFSFFLLKEPSKTIVDGMLLWWMPSFATASVTVQAPLSVSPAHRTLRLGSENTATSFVGSDDNSGAYSKGFRGEIAAYMAWSRKLTEEERWQVVRGSFGYDWRFGVPNGSSAEFAADASGEARTTVTAKCDSVAFLPGKLTEESPTLTIKGEVIPREAGIGKILSIAPVLSDGAEARMEVSVNGEPLGTYDLSSRVGCNIVIPGRFWKAMADGCATIAMTRVEPFVGDLSLDAVTLCGGWRMSGIMTREGYARSRYSIGAVSPRSIQRGTMISSGSELRTIDVMAHVPKGAMDAATYTMSFTVSGFGANDNAQPHSISVNGTQVAVFPELAAGSTYQARIPASCLTSGENVFRLSNDAPVISGATRWAAYSGFEINVRPRSGFMVIYR